MANQDAYKKQLQTFGKISLAEGCSFLILLLIAMPLKYIFDIPELVKYVGWLHGLLFMLYAIQLLYITIEFKWKLTRATIYFIAAFLPLAPFWVERQLKKEVRTIA